jgi:ribonuclease HI
MKMKTIEIYSDGSCSGNPGIGGWAAVCNENGKKKHVSGSIAAATNNSMELMAVVEAVKAVKKPREIIIHTDSQYLILCWRHDEQWLTDKSRKNRELWMQLISAIKNGGHKVSFVKVAGHAGNEMNELADRLAKEQVVKMRHELFG